MRQMNLIYRNCKRNLLQIKLFLVNEFAESAFRCKWLRLIEILTNKN